MDDLMKSALARHRIKRQVSSAMIVQHAQNLLLEYLDMHMKPDIKVLSFVNKDIVIAFRHPAAKFAFQSILPAYEKALRDSLPDQEITRIICRTIPDAWVNMY